MKSTQWRTVCMIGLSILLLTGLWSGTLLRPANAQPAQASAIPSCRQIDTAKDQRPTGSTTMVTLEQGYRCLLAHYVEGKEISHKVLQGAINGTLQVLRQQGFTLTAPPAMLFKGDPTADYQVFLNTYNQITSQIVAYEAVKTQLIAVALYSMTQSLNDDHTAYAPKQLFTQEINSLDDSKPQPTFGIITAPITTSTQIYITDVLTGTPAAAAGLRPGDTILSLNGDQPFAGGQGTIGLAALLLPQPGTALNMTVLRPSTQATISVSLVAKSLKSPDVEAHLLPGSIAYVRLYTFTQHGGGDVLAAIARLQRTATLNGVVLDLRGNPGGYGDQAVRILSAFTHGTVLYYDVNGAGKRTPQRASSRVPLVHLPLAVLVDGGSASSSEIVAAAVRDLALGQVIGERSAGALGGAEFYALNDGSGMEVTVERVLGPLGEKVDGIGVAPKVKAAVQASDLSAGKDPGIEQALRALATATPAS